MENISRKDVRRFWSKVRKLSTCWEWISGKHPYGYGMMRFRHSKELAHRVSWVIHNGAIRNNLCVLHRCDNPSCVRPSHLFLGTRTDNAIDRVRKGRSACGDTHSSRTHPERVARGLRHGSRTHPERVACGERICSSKLTESAVVEILALKHSGVRAKVVAQGFGVHSGSIYYLWAGKTWKHIIR